MLLPVCIGSHIMLIKRFTCVNKISDSCVCLLENEKKDQNKISLKVLGCV